MLRASLALLVCMAFGASIAGAQDTHPLTNLPKAGAISTGFYFPDFPSKKFPAGDIVKVVVGMHNDGQETYNVTAILGSINSVTDFKLYVQNFTNKLYLKALEPGEELSVEYAFQTAPALPARDFIIALTLFYAKPSGEYLSTTFFNQTIEIVEKKQFIDFDLIFMYLILAGIVAGSGWFLAPYMPSFGVLNKKSTKKSSSKRGPAVAISSEQKALDDDEWIKGTSYDKFRKQKNASAEKLNKISGNASDGEKKPAATAPVKKTK